LTSWSIPAGGDGGSWSGNVYTSNTAGTYTIQGAYSSKTATATLKVNSGAATHFVVSGFPSPTIAGVAHSVSVTAYDLYGNVASGYAGSVRVSSSDGAAVLPANGGLAGGVGAFSVTLETAGSQSITATDTVTGSIAGSQTGITVNFGCCYSFCGFWFSESYYCGCRSQRFGNCL